MKIFWLVFLLLGTVKAATWVAKDGRSFDGELAGRRGDALLIRPEGKTYWSAVSRATLNAASLERADQWLNDPANLQRQKWRMALWRAWPKTVKVAPVRLLESAEDGMNFRSAHYQVQSDHPISEAAAQKILELAESQWQLVNQLPLYFPRADQPHEGAHLIRLFKTRESYERAGGQPGTAAMHWLKWRGRERKPVVDAVLIPFESLGLDSGDQLERQSFGIIRHELVHQLMSPEQKREAWLLEGMAEFVSTIPLQGDRFILTAHTKAIRQHLAGEANGGHRLALGKSIGFPPVATLLQMDIRALMQSPRLHYGEALLIIHHLAESPQALLAQHLELIAEAKQKESAKQLLESAPQIERQLRQKWSKQGLDLNFR